MFCLAAPHTVFLLGFVAVVLPVRRHRPRTLGAGLGDLRGVVPYLVSVGGAGTATLDDLLKRADLALYAAKHGGRNRIEGCADVRNDKRRPASADLTMPREAAT